MSKTKVFRNPEEMTFEETATGYRRKYIGYKVTDGTDIRPYKVKVFIYYDGCAPDHEFYDILDELNLGRINLLWTGVPDIVFPKKEA